MRSKTWMVLEIVMLIVWIITVIIFIIAIFSDSAECKANPLVFGVKYLEEQNNATFQCSCRFENDFETEILVSSEEWSYKSNNPYGLN